jgi:hypothetical protein
MQLWSDFVRGAVVTSVLMVGLAWGQEQAGKVPQAADANQSPRPGMRGEAMDPAQYTVVWYPSRPVSRPESSEDFGLVRQNVSAPVPLWGTRNDGLMLKTGVTYSRFSTNVILPDSHRPFPDELWNVQLGLNYQHISDNGRVYGAALAFGSPSDKPFHSLDEVDLGFRGFMQVPDKNGHDAWRFMVIYSPRSEFPYPIPCLAYIWNPSDTFHASLGVPPEATWQPTDRWTVNLSYMPPVGGNARATYRVFDAFFIYGGFETVHESYFLAGRDDNDDRFMGFEERLIAGTKWDLSPHVTWETNGGYAFDRSYGTGERWLHDLDDRVRLEPGPFLSTGLRIRF